MKKSLLFLVMASAILGCADNSALIKLHSTSTRTDVFKELTTAGGTPKGFADLRVTAALKTHKPDIYLGKDIHGTPAYKMLLNIDGQALLLQGNLHMENSESRYLGDPESGDGMRYRFSGTLRLKAGTHKIVVAIPEDGIAIEHESILLEGDANHLILEPVYGIVPTKKRMDFYGTTSFREGVKGVRMILNGRDV